jgi:hypothetical protein
MKKLEREKTLMEQDFFAPNFGEFINPWAQMWDGLRLIAPLFPIRWDVRYAQNYIFLTQSQLDILRWYGRTLYEMNPYAQGALNCLADYVVGRGFDYYCQARKYARKVSDDLISLCNRHLEDVLNKNKWWVLERELYIAPRRDGDAFLRYFAQDNGITKLRIVEPEQVRSPGQDNTDSQWAFGIKTDPDDRVEHLAYQVWYSNEQPDEVDADEITMFKNHLGTNVARGLSDFFNLQDILTDSEKLLRAGRVGEAIRQSVAWIEQFSMANQASITALQGSETDELLPRWGVSGTTGSGLAMEQAHKVMPGEVVRTEQDREFVNGPIGNAQNMDITLQASLKAAAVKLRVPSWVLTGDVTANFASALVAESPLTKRCEQDQFVHIKRYTEVCTCILDIAARQGILPEDTLEQIEVCAEGQPIAARDPKQETEICAILRANKLLSKRTWSAREDLDYDEEQSNIQAEPPDEALPAPQAPGEGAGTGESQSTTPGAAYSRLTSRSRIQ